MSCEWQRLRTKGLCVNNSKTCCGEKDHDADKNDANIEITIAESTRISVVKGDTTTDAKGSRKKEETAVTEELRYGYYAFGSFESADRLRPSTWPEFLTSLRPKVQLQSPNSRKPTPNRQNVNDAINRNAPLSTVSRRIGRTFPSGPTGAAWLTVNSLPSCLADGCEA